MGGPSTIYILELTESELLTLFTRYAMLNTKNALDSPDDDTILEKLAQLMDGKEPSRLQ